MKILFLLLALSLQAHAQSASVDLNALCQNVSRAQAPITDQPSAKEKNELKNCDSEGPYYGDQQSVNYQKARLCAFAQVDENVGLMFGGENILMQIYANGYGVKKNIDFAEHLVCLHTKKRSRPRGIRR